MKNIILLSSIIFSVLAHSIELHPYGAYIHNKKTKEKILAHCHWLWDDKTQGKVICLDMRIHLVNKHFQPIRELTKIRPLNVNRNDNLPGTDEYIRTPEDFKTNMIQKMQHFDFTGSNFERKKLHVENQFKKIAEENHAASNESFGLFVSSYIRNIPAVLALYPYALSLHAADSFHDKYFYPAKIKNKSNHFFKSLVKVITRKENKKISYKNSDFQSAVSVLER